MFSALSAHAKDGQLFFNQIRVDGPIPRNLLEAYTHALNKPASVSEVCTNLENLQRNLYNIGVYKDVLFEIYPDNELYIRLIPQNKFIAKIGTNVGQTEGSGYIRGTVNNGLGLCETVSIDSSVGTKTKSSNILQASVPMPFKNMANSKLETLAYTSARSIDQCLCSAEIFGLTLRLVDYKNTSVGLDSVYRILSNNALRPPASLQSQLGDNYKFSLFMNYIIDNTVLGPTEYENRGYKLKVESEMSLPPTTLPFSKTLLSLRSNFGLPSLRLPSFGLPSFGLPSLGLPSLGFPGFGKLGWSKSLSDNSDNWADASFNAQLGVISGEPSILDRFNLGGALNVRGFKDNHMGPHENGVALGGRLMACLGLSVYNRLPKANPLLRWHNFLNLGYLSQQTKLPSLSVGTGLVYSSSQARFELNLTFPLVSHQFEHVHKGISFGVGLDFL